MIERHFVRHYKSRTEKGIIGCYEVLGDFIDEQCAKPRFLIAYRPCYVPTGFPIRAGYTRTHESFYSTVLGGIPRFERITDPTLITLCESEIKRLYGK